MVLLFIGPSGSGKDTQADLLNEKFGFKVISSGDVFRDRIENGGEYAQEIKGYVERGEWVPDELTYKIMEEYLSKVAEKDLILTGAVRTFPQIELLDDVLMKNNRELSGVIYFELSDEVATERLLERGREDDTEEVIESRLAEFHESFKPILDEYDKRELLISIDASPTISEIHSEVLNRLNLDEEHTKGNTE